MPTAHPPTPPPDYRPPPSPPPRPQALGLDVEWLAYTRKDFIFPLVQKFPHRDPNEETNYLKARFPDGQAFILGPLTGDHWLVFVADFLDRSTTECADRTLDVRARARVRVPPHRGCTWRPEARRGAPR